MDVIAKSASEISQIISVIDEIAFQTNLLALNAGIEAARAGEAGPGFAVGASEVRALAQNSADAAKQIKTLIPTSSTQVKEGVKFVGETGRSLERMMTQVAEINGVIANIAAGAKKKAIGLAEVNVAISQMDEMTRRNAALVGESTAATHKLSRETAGLAQLVGQFRIEPRSKDALHGQLKKAAPNAFSQPMSTGAAANSDRIAGSHSQPARLASQAAVKVKPRPPPLTNGMLPRAPTLAAEPAYATQGARAF
jgi:methyl-accepting chemotaxis protein